jgi:hypothetical protein
MLGSSMPASSELWEDLGTSRCTEARGPVRSGRSLGDPGRSTARRRHISERFRPTRRVVEEDEGLEAEVGCLSQALGKNAPPIAGSPRIVCVEARRVSPGRPRTRDTGSLTTVARLPRPRVSTRQMTAPGTSGHEVEVRRAERPVRSLRSLYRKARCPPVSRRAGTNQQRDSHERARGATRSASPTIARTAEANCFHCVA